MCTSIQYPDDARAFIKFEISDIVDLERSIDWIFVPDETIWFNLGEFMILIHWEFLIIWILSFETTMRSSDCWLEELEHAKHCTSIWQNNVLESYTQGNIWSMLMFSSCKVLLGKEILNVLICWELEDWTISWSEIEDDHRIELICLSPVSISSTFEIRTMIMCFKYCFSKLSHIMYANNRIIRVWCDIIRVESINLNSRNRTCLDKSGMYICAIFPSNGSS